MENIQITKKDLMVITVFYCPPHVDHLFDRGFISFKDSGELLISNYLDDEIKKKWQLEVYLIHPFSQKQCKYLKYHRDNIFK
jgi:predicted restriction endonuclease